MLVVNGETWRPGHLLDDFGEHVPVWPIIVREEELIVAVGSWAVREVIAGLDNVQKRCLCLTATRHIGFQGCASLTRVPLFET